MNPCLSSPSVDVSAHICRWWAINFHCTQKTRRNRMGQMYHKYFLIFTTSVHRGTWKYLITLSVLSVCVCTVWYTVEAFLSARSFSRRHFNSQTREQRTVGLSFSPPCARCYFLCKENDLSTSHQRNTCEHEVCVVSEMASLALLFPPPLSLYYVT